MNLELYRYDIVGFAEHVLGICLHKGQQDFLREAIRFNEDGTLMYRFVNFTASNRWGKTVELAVVQLFFATYKHGLLTEGEDWAKHPYGIINLCPLVDLANVLRDMVNSILLSESKEQINNPKGRGRCIIGPLFERGNDGYTVTFGDYKGFRTKMTHVTMEYRTTDDNAKAVQGTPKFLVTFDEAGRQKNFQNLMGAHIVPRTLDTGGLIATATTPDVDTGTDYEEWWKKGDPENAFRDPLFYSARGSIYDNPHVTPKMIEELKSGTPPYLLPQVLEGRFVQSSEAFFSKLALDEAFKAELSPNFSREKDRYYIIAADFAVSKAGDRSVFVVLDATSKPYTVKQVYEPARGTPHPDLIEKMKQLLEFYHAEWKQDNQIVHCEALATYDSTGLGGKMFQTEMSTLFPRPRGYDFGGMTKKKLQILSSLRLLLDKGWIVIPGEYAQVKQELKDYKRQDDKLQTDSVMALALAAHLAERTAPMELDNSAWEQGIY